MKKHRSKNGGRHLDSAKRRFKKSLVSYLLMLVFFGFLFLRDGMPSFVFFIIAIPMTISIIHKYIDASGDEQDDHDNIQDIPEPEERYEDEVLDKETLELDDFKSLRKEWKDSDFV